MNLIEKFNRSPRDFPNGELKALAQEVRERIIEVVSRNGGHLASSLGAVEIAIALLKVFDSEKDRIIFDVGHQSYAWKILTGRSEAFDTLRQHGGIAGFPRICESSSDAFGAGHAGTAISAALGMAAARDIKGSDEAVVAVVGDAAITNGISLEALNNTLSSTKRIILILNDNEMSISENVGALSRHFGRLLSSRRYNKIKTAIENFAKKIRIHWLSNIYHRIESSIKSLFVRNVVFEELGLRYIGPLDGHNTDRLIKAFTIARDYNRPIVLHLATQKGRGYRYAEDDPSLWHGVGAFDVESGRFKSSKVRDYSEAFGEKLTVAARDDKRIVAITAAMRSGTGLDSYAKAFPNRFYDVGICEEHAVTFAAGLAAQGMRPFVAIYSTFAQRAVDSVFHDVAIQNLPVTLCLDRAGAVGADGVTHHGLYDIPMLRPLPNLVIAQPRDEEMMQALIELSLKMSTPFVIRYPRGAVTRELCKTDHPLSYGRASIVRKPNGKGERRIWIWALGDMISTAVTVAEALEKEGVASVGVVDPIFIKPYDRALLRAQFSEGAEIVTMENAILAGGFGAALAEDNPDIAIRRFGWQDKILEHGTPAELFREQGLDAASIIESMQHSSEFGVRSSELGASPSSEFGARSSELEASPSSEFGVRSSELEASPSSEFGVRSSEIYDADKSSEYGVRSKELFSEHSNGMQKKDSELRTPNSELNNNSELRTPSSELNNNSELRTPSSELNNNSELIHAAIVDLDGVVLDSLGVWQDIDRDYLKAHGLDGRPEINARLNNSSTLMDAALYLHEECGIEKSPEAICDEFNLLLGDYYRHTLTLIPGAKEAMDALKAKGLKLALVTASPSELVHAALRRNGIDDYFDHFFCLADKMKKETFEEVLAALGSTEKTTVVYDDLERIRKVAEGLGFKTYASL